ncbi:hypothetical protein Poly51_00610 [Rubripirellula tenax]|uniref:Uncharacterized protein n=1 Tax=Rubripirellula tenax TaxID=2528015 RepID=A0A5C6FIC3_9BACT|nr:hypothetical protein Poly51_00610 [Rubripirellula tenax]
MFLTPRTLPLANTTEMPPQTRSGNGKGYAGGRSLAITGSESPRSANPSSKSPSVAKSIPAKFPAQRSVFKALAVAQIRPSAAWMSGSKRGISAALFPCSCFRNSIR